MEILSTENKLQALQTFNRLQGKAITELAERSYFYNRHGHHFIQQGLSHAFAALVFIHINADFGADVVSRASVIIAERGPSQHYVLLESNHPLISLLHIFYQNKIFQIDLILLETVVMWNLFLNPF